MHIYLFEKNEKIVKTLQELMGEEHSFEKVITNENELHAALQNDKIDILYVNIGELAKELKDKISEVVPYIIVFTENPTPDSFKRSLELRANDFLQLPVKKEEITKAQLKAVQYIKEMPLAQKNRFKKQTKVLSFFSSKGGTGKSVLAANTAFSLVRDYKQKVLLIDTVPRFGCQDVLLDTTEKKSMATIPTSMENEEAYWLEIQNSTIKKEDGLDILLAGDKNEDIVSTEKLKTILGVVKEKYDYVLIDTDNTFSELNLSLMEISDQIIYISTPDVAALKNLKLGLETLKAYYYSTDKIKITINRFDKLNELTIVELEKFLKYKIAFIIPEDRESIIRSINKGIPFIGENPDSEICQAMNKLISCLLGKTCETPVQAEDQAAGNGKNWWKGLSNILGGK